MDAGTIGILSTAFVALFLTLWLFCSVAQR
jgi:hypothetical protein